MFIWRLSTPPPTATPLHEADRAKKHAVLVAASVLTGRIDHVELTEHVGLGVTVEMPSDTRPRRRKQLARGYLNRDLTRPR